MASIQKTGTGWRAQVAKNKKRASKVFKTKREAQDWAARQEYTFTNGEKVAAQMPLADLFDRYAREVSPGKRGARWEVLRLARLAREPIARLRLGDLSAADFAAWRDRRLLEVSPGSVRREMVLISAVLTQARREWGLISSSPIEDVRKPPQPPARDRLPSGDDFKRLAVAAGSDLTKATARAHHAFLFACETAMRAGEIVGLTWDRVDLDRRVAKLPVTKNGTAREVPLSGAAVELLRGLPGGDPVFGLTSRQLEALWRKVRNRAAVDDLRFHDSRHYAITHLSKRLDVLALARAVGHKNISQLLIYYNESAEDLARRLD